MGDPQEVRAKRREPLKAARAFNADQECTLRQVLDVPSADLVAEKPVYCRKMPDEQAIAGGRVSGPPGVEKRLIVLVHAARDDITADRGCQRTRLDHDGSGMLAAMPPKNP